MTSGATADNSQSVSIALNGQTSTAICIQDYSSGSFQLPASVTGANVAVHVSQDGTNYNALEDLAGDPVAVVPISANENCPIPAEAFDYKFLKLVAASAQAAARTILFLLRSRSGMYVHTENVTIAESETDSDPFVVQDFNAGGFQVPAAITGTTFAIHVSNDGTNFNALQTAAGAAVDPVPVSNDEACALPPETFNYKYAKFVSSDAEDAGRTVLVFLKYT